MVCCTSDVCSRRRFPRRHCVACSLSTLKSRSAREDTGDTGPGHLCGGSASPKGLALSFRGRKGRPASGKQSRLGFFSFLNTGFLSGRGGHAAARSCSQGPFPSLLGGGRTLHRLSLAPDRPTGPAARLSCSSSSSSRPAPRPPSPVSAASAALAARPQAHALPQAYLWQMVFRRLHRCFFRLRPKDPPGFSTSDLPSASQQPCPALADLLPRVPSPPCPPHFSGAGQALGLCPPWSFNVRT